jgi:hypothetical protein
MFVCRRGEEPIDNPEVGSMFEFFNHSTLIRDRNADKQVSLAVFTPSGFKEARFICR